MEDPVGLSGSSSFAQLEPWQLVVIKDAGFLLVRFVVVEVVALLLLRKMDLVVLVDLQQVVWHFEGFEQAAGSLSQKLDSELVSMASAQFVLQ